MYNFPPLVREVLNAWVTRLAAQQPHHLISAANTTQ
jgi:hypothetical protein